MNEEWRPVVGYENEYEVSNLGNVRRVLKGRPAQPRKLVKGRRGYYELILCKKNKVKLCRVHRLVSEAFLPNPDNLPMVNHKDGDKTNNSVSNLEWTTAKHNQLHSRRILKNAVHPVKCVETGVQYDSMAIAAEATSTDLSHLRQAAIGTRNKAGGYHWQLVEPNNAGL